MAFELRAALRRLWRGNFWKLVGAQLRPESVIDFAPSQAASTHDQARRLSKLGLGPPGEWPAIRMLVLLLA